MSVARRRQRRIASLMDGLAFPHAATSWVAEPEPETTQSGQMWSLQAAQTSRVCAPEGSHRGTVWQTKRGRAASAGHVAGTCTAGRSRLGPCTHLLERSRSAHKGFGGRSKRAPAALRMVAVMRERTTCAPIR